MVDIAFPSRGIGLVDSKLLTELAKTAKGGKKLRTALLYSMKDFAPYHGDFLFNQSGRLDLPNLPPADMVFLTFVSICGHSYAGRFEKVAWSVAFIFKSVPFAFSLQKFGLRLYHHKDVLPPRVLSEEMLRSLAKAMDIVGKLMEPMVSTQLSAGNVTLVNSFPQLHRMYGYFREQANKSFKQEPKPAKRKAKDLGKVLTRKFQRDAAGGYNTIAMIDAYFSRLEHLLIILLAFADYDRSKHDLVKLMSGFWSEKFKTIFDLGKNTIAKDLYDRLVSLRQRHRNPIAHGNFQKDGKSLYFHFGPAGAISCHLSSSDERPKFLFTAETLNFKETCSLFDELDEFLEKGITRYGYLYAKSGLNVTYDEKSIEKYRAAARNDEIFTEFLKNESHIADMHANMDW